MAYEATVIEDSVSALGSRLTTMQLTYPRFVHSEFMTHRAFSRNAASSRAIPMARFREKTEADPVWPVWWGKNQAGMQAFEAVDGDNAEVAKARWRIALLDALHHHKVMEDCPLHKQVANRILEPWFWITVVVTGSDAAWANFFHLRCHFAAMPEIQKSGFMAADHYFDSVPFFLHAGQWHLPYVTRDERATLATWDAVRSAVARCARVSYLNQGKVPTREEDAGLYMRLRWPGGEGRDADDPVHASCFEHVARSTEERNAALAGNFGPGWVQHRKEIMDEFRTVFTPLDLIRRREVVREKFGRTWDDEGGAS